MNGQNGVAPLCAVAPNGSNRHSIGVEAGYAPFAEVNINAVPIRALLGGGFTTPASTISMGAFRGGPPTYTISGPSSISEGSAGIFTVNTTNVANGTQLWWTASTGGAVTSADFSPASGVFTVNNNQGQFAVNVASDSTDFANETFTVSVRRNSATDTIRATSPTVTINDTSPPNPIFVTFTSSFPDAAYSAGNTSVGGGTVTGGPYVPGRANTINVTVNFNVVLHGTASNGTGLRIVGLTTSDTLNMTINGTIMGFGGAGGRQTGVAGGTGLSITGRFNSLSGSGRILGGGGGGGGNNGFNVTDNAFGGGGAGGGPGGAPGGGPGGGVNLAGSNGVNISNNRGGGGGGRIFSAGAFVALGALKTGNVAAGGMGGQQGGGGGAFWQFTGNGACRVVGGNGGNGSNAGLNSSPSTIPPASSLLGAGGGGGGGFGAQGGSGANQRVTGGNVAPGGAGGPAARLNGSTYPNVTGWSGTVWGVVF
jgi:hypothetical protein